MIDLCSRTLTTSIIGNRKITDTLAPALHTITVNVRCFDRGAFSKEMFLGKIDVNLASLAQEDIDVWYVNRKYKQDMWLVRY
jgi:hypothetical protein